MNSKPIVRNSSATVARRALRIRRVQRYPFAEGWNCHRKTNSVFVLCSRVFPECYRTKPQCGVILILFYEKELARFRETESKSMCRYVIQMIKNI
mmetsp:Transcript_10961/g.26360  ORF Transcript_10961/g.26360 Transcript_10961/m.26360 type:complete len:95 (-) Transcript_10961:15-299(-)